MHVSVGFKDKLRHIFKTLRVYLSQKEFESAAPNRKWLGARHQQGRDCYREKVEAKKFLDGL